MDKNKEKITRDNEKFKAVALGVTNNIPLPGLVDKADNSRIYGEIRKDLQVLGLQLDVKQLTQIISLAEAICRWAPITNKPNLIKSIERCVVNGDPLNVVSYSCPRIKYGDNGEVIGLFNTIGTSDSIPDKSDRENIEMESHISRLAYNFGVPSKVDVYFADTDYTLNWALWEPNSELHLNSKDYANSATVWMQSLGINDVHHHSLTTFLQEACLWQTVKVLGELLEDNLMSHKHFPGFVTPVENHYVVTAVGHALGDLSSEVENTSHLSSILFPNRPLDGNNRLEDAVRYAIKLKLYEMLLLRIICNNADILVYPTKDSNPTSTIRRALQYLAMGDELFEGYEKGRKITLATPYYLRKRNKDFESIQESESI